MLTREQFNDYCAQWELTKKGISELWKYYTKKSEMSANRFISTEDGLLVTLDPKGGISMTLVDREASMNIIRAACKAEDNYYETHHLEEVL